MKKSVDLTEKNPVFQNPFKSIEWIANDKYRIWLHLLFWLFVYLDKILALSGAGDSPYLTPYSLVYYFLLDAGMVYFILYVLVPAFLLSDRLYAFAGLTIITLFINVELSYLLTMHVFCVDCLVAYEGGVAMVLIEEFAGSAFIFGTAIGANILRRFLKSQILIRKLELEKLETELNFLKAQINPHFLFNSLNNIYVQIRKNSEEAADSVLHLSDLLRYQIYDCSKNRVELEAEITYLKNYLKLDKLRKSSVQIDMKVEGDTSGVRVAPYLFIPFVENAMIHGVGMNEEAFINIYFQIEGDTLLFELTNSKPKRPIKKESGGIGLVNVRRRLDLLYTNRYELDIQSNEKTFKIQLKLNTEESLFEDYHS